MIQEIEIRRLLNGISFARRTLQEKSNYMQLLESIECHSEWTGRRARSSCYQSARYCSFGRRDGGMRYCSVGLRIGYGTVY